MPMPGLTPAPPLVQAPTPPPPPPFPWQNLMRSEERRVGKECVG